MLVIEKKRLEITENTINHNLKVSKVLVFGEVREEEVPIFLMMLKKCCKVDSYHCRNGSRKY